MKVSIDQRVWRFINMSHRSETAEPITVIENKTNSSTNEESSLSWRLCCRLDGAERHNVNTQHQKSAARGEELNS